MRSPWRRFSVASGVAVLALFLAACTEHVEQPPADGGRRPQDFIVEPVGRFALEVDQLWQLVFWVAVAIFILVMGLLLVAILRYRERPDDDGVLPKQIHGNPRLEALWTVIPALILAAVAVPTVQTIFELATPPDEAMVIEVMGHQFWWEFVYPEEDGLVTANELVIPTDTEVVLHMDSTDVIHSFWVPKLTGKQDVVPGHTNILRLYTEEEGEYLGQCAEFCGVSHANMRMRVLAVPPDEFEAWAAQQAEPIDHPRDGGAVSEGEDLFAQHCIACHQVRGHPAGGARTAPDLTYFADRGWFAGAIFVNDVTEGGDNIREWLENPPRMKPMEVGTPANTGMPAITLTDEEIDALVDYLSTLSSDDPIQRPDPVRP